MEYYILITKETLTYQKIILVNKLLHFTTQLQTYVYLEKKIISI